MAALVAALLAYASDRTPALAARLGDRFEGSAAALAGLVLTLIAANVVGAAGAVLLVDFTIPEARLLLLALALLSAGLVFGKPKPVPAAEWRLGSFLTAVTATALIGFGDRAQFLVFAIGARNAWPWAAAVGGSIAACAVAVPAFLLGEAALKPVPWRAIRIGAGVLFLVAGAIAALSAFALV